MSKTKPVVSILCITYNHEKYIAEALDGFVRQETDFPFEVIVHDDASTDSTAKIIKDYQKRYPEVIKPILEKQNRYSKDGVRFVADMLNMAQGEFIAQCEGDDYWTDPQKLQKQIDYMRANPDCTICFHPVRVTFTDSTQEDYVYPQNINTNDFTLLELINQNYMQSNSVLFRRQTYKNYPTDIAPLDWYTNLYHARRGGIGFINETMAVYRRHQGGIWWGAISKTSDFWNSNIDAHLRFYEEMIKLFPEDKYANAINTSFARIIDMVIELKESPHIIARVIKKYPGLITRYIMYRCWVAQAHNTEIDLREKRIADLYKSIAEHRSHITKLESELAKYHNSLLYRVHQKGSQLLRYARKR